MQCTQSPPLVPFTLQASKNFHEFFVEQIADYPRPPVDGDGAAEIANNIKLGLFAY